MTDVTVHINVPRQIWQTAAFEQDLETHDRIVGEFIRTAANEGLRMIDARVSDNVRIKHIEITLDDSVTSAEAEE